jgi:hypothetical protein
VVIQTAYGAAAKQCYLSFYSEPIIIDQRFFRFWPLMVRSNSDELSGNSLTQRKWKPEPFELENQDIIETNHQAKQNWQFSLMKLGNQADQCDSQTQRKEQ